MYCHNCGHQILGDETCPDCGAEVHNQEPEPNHENLPVPVEEPTGKTPEEKLREANRNAPDSHRPIKAYDVGDEDLDPNPRASDLGYVEGGGDVAVAVNIGGTDRIMYDECNGDARIDCDAESFIDDVSGWA